MQSKRKDKRLNIFLTHGRDLGAKEEITTWLKERKGISIRTIDLSTFIEPGDTTHIKLSELATEGDAAIILATADDLGNLKGSDNITERARQNVWIELGWFWAKLGLKRTLLLLKGNIDIPSNLHGITYLKYESSINEVSPKFDSYLNTLYQQEPDSLTEVIYFSSNVNQSDSQWSEIHKVSLNNLSILGIANARLVHLLPNILKTMEKGKKRLTLELLVMHPSYCVENKTILEANHGFGTIEDNKRFYLTLVQYLKSFESLDGRIIVNSYSCLPTFAAVTADGDSFGGTMVVRPFLRNARTMGFNYPGFKLKNRSESGAFNLFWKSINAIKQDKNNCVTLTNNASIIEFVKSQFD